MIVLLAAAEHVDGDVLMVGAGGVVRAGMLLKLAEGPEGHDPFEAVTV